MKRAINLTKILLILLIFYSSSMFCQIKDIDGWDRVSFGMSREEVYNLYRDSNIMMGDTMRIKKYDILRQEFKVEFCFTKDDALFMVRLDHKNSFGKDFPAFSFKVFDEALTSKYGSSNASNIREENTEITKTISKVWDFPNTQIKLEYWAIRISSILSIIYNVKTIETRL